MPIYQTFFSGLTFFKASWNYTLIMKMCWTQNIIDSLIFFLCLFAQDQEQSTPLHAAAYMGDVQTMDLLIASGQKTFFSLPFSVPQYLIYFIYSIHTAPPVIITNNESTMVQKRNVPFCFTGAKVNVKDQGLLTPLHRAAASQNEVCSHFKRWIFFSTWPPGYKCLTCIVWNLCFSSESCGAVTKAQSRGQHTGQVLAYTITHGSCEVGYRVRFSSDTSCVQPGCCWQIRKDPTASCSIQWPRRGKL